MRILTVILLTFVGTALVVYICPEADQAYKLMGVTIRLTWLLAGSLGLIFSKLSK